MFNISNEQKDPLARTSNNPGQEHMVKCLITQYNQYMIHIAFYMRHLLKKTQHKTENLFIFSLCLFLSFFFVLMFLFACAMCVFYTFIGGTIHVVSSL